MLVFCFFGILTIYAAMFFVFWGVGQGEHFAIIFLTLTMVVVSLSFIVLCKIAYKIVKWIFA